MIDINSDNFAILSPHFVSTNPLKDDDIKEALHLMYSKIIETYKNVENNPTGVLLRALASIIQNSNWIKQIANDNAGHPFLCIPLLNHPDLLSRLKER